MRKTTKTTAIAVILAIIISALVLSLIGCNQSKQEQVFDLRYNTGFYYKGAVYTDIKIFKEGVETELDFGNYYITDRQIINDNLYFLCFENYLESVETASNLLHDWAILKFDLNGENKKEIFRTQSSASTDIQIGAFDIPVFDKFDNAYYYFINEGSKQTLYKYVLDENSSVKIADYDNGDMYLTGTTDEKHLWLSEQSDTDVHYQINKQTFELKQVEEIPTQEENIITADGFTYYLKDEQDNISGGKTLCKKSKTEDKIIADLSDILIFDDEHTLHAQIAGIENGKILTAIHGSGCGSFLKTLYWINIATGEKTKIY